MSSEFEKYLKATFGRSGPATSPTSAPHPWAAIWTRMTMEERRHACRELLVQAAKLPQALESALASIAESERTTPETVARWSLDKQADRFARAPTHPEPNLGSLVATFLVKCRAPMLARFCDVAEIPNTNGAVDLRTVRDPIPCERVLAGLRAISAEFPPRDVDLYLDAMEAQRLAPWANIPKARALLSREGAVAAGSSSPPRSPAPPAPPAPPRIPELPTGAFDVVVSLDRGEVHLADVERLTPLDALVRERTLATTAGVYGAPRAEELRSVVEELLRMNPSRHRSWVHLGFLDILEGREPHPDLARGSERDRGWYLAGAIAAYERAGDRAAIVATYDRYPTELRRILGDRHEATGDVGGILIDALCAAGRAGPTVSALVPTAVSKGGRRVFETLLRVAREHVQGSKAAEASAVLSLLSDGVEASVRRQDRLDAGIAEEVALLQAVALRLHGGFEPAQTRLRPLLGSRLAGVAARAAGELGFVACRIRSLSDVRLPLLAADLSATASRLQAGREQFEAAAVPENPARAEADYVLGLLAFARGEAEPARVALERAVAAIQAGQAVTEGSGVLARARLALGVLLAETLDEGRAEEALDHVVAGATERPDEAPISLLARGLSALSASGTERVSRAVEGLFAAMGDRLLSAAIEADLLGGHDGLREALLTRVEDLRRPRRDRGEDALALLRGALRALDVPRATRALSVLEDLADDAEGRARLLGVLSERARYDPAWDASEATAVRVRLLEAEGRYPEAARELVAAAHDALSKDAERGLVVAREHAAAIEGYGSVALDPTLSARIVALSPRETGSDGRPVARAGRIFVIGGNEVQARYEAQLRATFAARQPGVVLDFDFTGWSSNWGRTLPQTESRIAEADAVVVLRFIRTMLGRAVRELSGRHGTPWVPCTGHGRDSLLAAIERAAELLPPG